MVGCQLVLKLVIMEEKQYTLEELEDKLTKREKIFCHEYIIFWNGAEAARKAGYSKDSAKEIASQNLTKLHINQYIKYIQQDIAKEAGISPLSQILELKKIAYGNITDFYDDWGKLKPFEELTDNQKSMLQEISHKVIKLGDTDFDVELVKLKGHDKRAAIQEINKILGFYAPEEKNIKLSGEVSGFMPDGFED